MFAVETVGLAKKYKKTQALEGVDLSIDTGEIFALLGPNGAGKTTWISIVCGLVRATAGTARVFGHDISTQSLEARRAIGLVPQEVNFDPFFSPRELLRFQLGYYGVKKDEERIDEILRAVSLYDKRDANARELSGGMRRRLLIAKALVHRPKIVFLDEPTAGVDVTLRRDLWNYVRKLRSEGTTIVLTTHYLEEAEELADRIAVIDHGKLITVDKPAKLLAAHGRKQLRITLKQPLAAVPESLRAYDPVVDGDRLTLVTPTQGLGALFAAIAALDPVDVSTEQPSLEQVFWKLTGSERA